jgi:hypothetical protein
MGRCPYGYKCRFLHAHLGPDGQTLVVREGATDYHGETANFLSAQQQEQLRKHQYPFVRSARVAAALHLAMPGAPAPATKAAGGLGEDDEDEPGDGANETDDADDGDPDRAGEDTGSSAAPPQAHAHTEVDSGAPSEPLRERKLVQRAVSV